MSQFCLFCKHKEELHILLFLVLQSSQNKYLPSKAATVIIIRVIFSSAASLTHANCRSQVRELCVVCLDNEFHVETSRWKPTGSDGGGSLVSWFSDLTQNQVSKSLEWFLLSIKSEQNCLNECWRGTKTLAHITVVVGTELVPARGHQDR